MGAPHIRIFAGDLPSGVTKGQGRALCIGAIEECSEHAAKHGVVLGLENHGGIVASAAELLDIVRAIKSPWFGVNLDTGNFRSDDPYADLAACLPYAVNVQVKVEVQRRGQPKEAADLDRIGRLLRESRYQGFVALEYEAAEDPWQAVPRHLAALRRALRG
jgi:sugar phosphate isomerase/epimerase